MNRIDAFLLDRLCQPICDRLYDWVGNCITIARHWYRLAIGLTGIMIGWRIGGSILHHEPIPFLLFFLSTQCFLSAAIIYSAVRLRHFQFTGSNPLRIILFPVRIVIVIWFLAMCVLSTISLDVLEIIRDFCVVCGTYFTCCDKRPPFKLARRQQFVPA